MQIPDDVPAWHSFRQNNSGGYYEGTREYHVFGTYDQVLEWADTFEAIHGDDPWCRCCGRRWDVSVELPWSDDPEDYAALTDKATVPEGFFDPKYSEVVIL
jgi:hypothetical protein